MKLSELKQEITSNKNYAKAGMKVVVEGESTNIYLLSAETKLLLARISNTEVGNYSIREGLSKDAPMIHLLVDLNAMKYSQTELEDRGV